MTKLKFGSVTKIKKKQRDPCLKVHIFLLNILTKEFRLIRSFLENREKFTLTNFKL